MSDAEKIEHLIRGTSFEASAEMDEQLRANVARADSTGQPAAWGSDQTQIGRLVMSISTKRIVIALAACVIIGAGAIAAVTAGRYFYMGRGDGVHHFISDDGQRVVTMDDEEVTDVEQSKKDLAEVDALAQQGQRELIRVTEQIVNGHLERRKHLYKYTLSDGRTMEMQEGVAGTYTLDDAQWEEWLQLRDTGPGESLGTYEEDVEGRPFVFQKQQYILNDGTKIVWSVGKPKTK